jgi:hypothetical protein
MTEPNIGERFVVVHPTKVCSNVDPGNIPALWPATWHPTGGWLVNCKCGDLGVEPHPGNLGTYLLEMGDITGVSISVSVDGKLAWRNRDEE